MTILDTMGIIPIDYNANKYWCNGSYVPRVNDILSTMLHEDYLMGWSNAIGLYKRQKYEDVLKAAADKGTYVHDGIDEFLKTNIDLNMESVPYKYTKEVNNAYNAFKSWWEIINKYNTVKVLMNESQLICNYFGGTLDLLISINGRVYLMDFKTSNHLNYKYFLQLSAYRYMLRTVYNIDIDGVGILKLSKKHMLFEEHILDFKSNYNHKMFMDDCESTFLSLVYAYYQQLQTRKYYEVNIQ